MFDFGSADGFMELAGFVNYMDKKQKEEKAREERAERERQDAENKKDS